MGIRLRNVLYLMLCATLGSSLCTKPGFTEYGGSCYRILYSPKLLCFNDAEHLCQSIGAQLAVIRCPNENELVRRLALIDKPLMSTREALKRNKAPEHELNMWIGAKGCPVSHVPQWIQKSERHFTYRNWCPTEPKCGLPDQEQCVTYSICPKKGGIWSMQPCKNKTLAVLCEERTINSGGACKAFKQPVLATSKCLRSPTTCPTGFRQSHDSCYSLIESPLDFANARINCRKLDQRADVATIRTEAENRAIIAYVEACKTLKAKRDLLKPRFTKAQEVMLNMWIGMHGCNKTRIPQWFSASERRFTYRNWAKGQPHLAIPDDQCVWFSLCPIRGIGVWGDQSCGAKMLATICQIRLGGDGFPAPDALPGPKGSATVIEAPEVPKQQAQRPPTSANKDQHPVAAIPENAKPKPGGVDPSKSTQKDVAKPGPKDPVKPSEQVAAKPGVKDSAKPGQNDPAKPVQPEAAKPGQKDTAKPGVKDTAKPDAKGPVAPGQNEAAKPGQNAPTNPAEKDAARPGLKDPIKSVQKEVAKPGAKDAAKPGQNAPANPAEKDAAKPGPENPTNPGQKEAAKPGAKDAVKPSQNTPHGPNSSSNPAGKDAVKPGPMGPAKPGAKGTTEKGAATAKPGGQAPTKPGQKDPVKPVQNGAAKADEKNPAKPAVKDVAKQPVDQANNAVSLAEPPKPSGPCPLPGFTNFGGTCYRIILAPKGVRQIVMRQRCQQLGVEVDLGTIRCAAENSAVMALASQMQALKKLLASSKPADIKKQNIWLGLHTVSYNNAKNQEKWFGTSTAAFRNWASQEPAYVGSENCVQLSLNASILGQWHSTNCASLSYAALCEIQLDTNGQGCPNTDVLATQAESPVQLKPAQQSPIISKDSERDDTPQPDLSRNL
ncbi:unnamed protein product, partial [Mesorhabditis spiculigera]